MRAALYARVSTHDPEELERTPRTIVVSRPTECNQKAEWALLGCLSNRCWITTTRPVEIARARECGVASA
jgi:hypothetical protein